MSRYERISLAHIHTTNSRLNIYFDCIPQVKAFMFTMQDSNTFCTMLLEQIKGFYYGITKIFLLVGSYTMLSW